jgi:hypothetical protein
VTAPEAASERGGPRCRSCDAALGHTLVDLGTSPLCESYVSAEDLDKMEPFYPLRVYVCERCFLVQLEAFVPPEEIFGDYAYFSSYADSWVQHCERYCDEICAALGIGPDSFVVEVASNDGYLLQHFVAKGIAVLGIEPAVNIAVVAERKGVPTLVQFFGTGTARALAAQGKRADLLVGNNVLAQVTDLHDFVEGMRLLLKPGGVVTLEFPHLVRLMEESQFDTIYHEHFSYFSFFAVERLFAEHALELFRVDELRTHGGSLRIYARHAGSNSTPPHPSVAALRQKEKAFGIDRLDTYSRFAEHVKETKRALLEFLIQAKRDGKTVVGYGAPGKGNTLLNYCGIRTDFVDFTVDRNPHKQGKFLPGTRIPVLHPDAIRAARPDYVLILPWNLKDEIMEQVAYIAEWGGRFVLPIPRVQVYDAARLRHVEAP